MKKALFVVSLAMLPTMAQADTLLGLYAGVGQWQAGFKGEVGENGASTTLGDLGLEKEPSNVMWANFEHPIPILPNIRVMHTRISTLANSTTSRQFNLAGYTVNANVDVIAKMDMSHTDATLYYELLDNWVTLDAGLTARQFTGFVEIRSEVTATIKADLEGVIPMLYLNAQFDLPFSGWYVGATANAVSFQGDGVEDYSGRIGYDLDLVAMDLGVSIGYRSLSMKVAEIGNLYADAVISGAFAEIKIHF